MATYDESVEHYKNLGYEQASSDPLKFNGGRTDWDKDGKRPIVYLHPRLHDEKVFPLDYQLWALLEEAIHCFQLKKLTPGADYSRDRLGYEADAKGRIIKIAHFIGFDQEIINFIKSEKNYAIIQSLWQG